MADALRQAVLDRLGMVIDPELGENLVDLGLIYSVDVDPEGNARIEMTTTTRGCPAASYLQDAVQTAALGAPGVGRVEVTLTYQPPWSPDRMSEALSGRFGG